MRDVGVIATRVRACAVVDLALAFLVRRIRALRDQLPEISTFIAPLAQQRGPINVRRLMRLSLSHFAYHFGYHCIMTHCDFMLKKMGKRISVLNKLINKFLIINHQSIIALCFEYCAILIISMGKTQLGTLQRAQKSYKSHITL